METQTCKHKLKCVHCQKEFSPIRSDQRFCNATCRGRNWAEKQPSKPLVLIYYVRESQKKGFFRKLLNWIW